MRGDLSAAERFPVLWLWGGLAVSVLFVGSLCVGSLWRVRRCSLSIESGMEGICWRRFCGVRGWFGFGLWAGFGLGFGAGLFGVCGGGLGCFHVWFRFGLCWCLMLLGLGLGLGALGLGWVLART